MNFVYKMIDCIFSLSPPIATSLLLIQNCGGFKLGLSELWCIRLTASVNEKTSLLFLCL